MNRPGPVGFFFRNLSGAGKKAKLINSRKTLFRLEGEEEETVRVQAGGCGSLKARSYGVMYSPRKTDGSLNLGLRYPVDILRFPDNFSTIIVPPFPPRHRDTF